MNLPGLNRYVLRYVVVDTKDNEQVSDPEMYCQAKDVMDELNELEEEDDENRD